MQGFGQRGRRFLLANKSHLTLPCLQAPSSRSCLSTWLAPGCMSPGALARSPCPSEDDEGCCLLRPVCPPGIVLSLVHGCWGRIRLLQPSKGTGGGSVSSFCPTAVSHQDFCLLIWMCREATDRCAGIVQTQQSSSHHQSLHPITSPIPLGASTPDGRTRLLLTPVFPFP